MEFKIFVDDVKGEAGFHAETASGRKLSRLESAHILTKITAGLIADGIRENGTDLIVPFNKQLPRFPTS